MVRLRWVGVLGTLLILFTAAGVQADEQLDDVVGDVADYWSPVIEDAEVGLPQVVYEDSLDEVTPAQMIAPQRQLRVAQNQRPPRAVSTASATGLASVPFMIGDTGSGTCLSIGGLSTFTIEHPTLTCSRLNVSENNSPLPFDRTYVSYRHFHNVTDVRVLTLFERSYDVDRVTIGHERTFWEGLGSVEVRLPLERRLTSNFSSVVNTLVDPAIIEPFRGGRQNEIGNVATILKMLLMEGSDYAVSGGLGITAPTAEDFTYGYFLNNTFDFEFDPNDPPALLREFEDFGLEIQNETVYLTPYLGWIYVPTPRFFHHGFLQVEVAANPSTVRARGGGQIDFVDDTDPNNPVFIPLLFAFTPTQGLETQLHAQTLMRLNLGCGYVFTENPQARCIKNVTGLLELHYTTTLQDAKLSTIPLDVEPPFFAGTFDEFFTFGNFMNRSDIVNVGVGLSANIGAQGRTLVTNGLVLPVTQGDQRAFDLEYNLQVQRNF